MSLDVAVMNRSTEPLRVRSIRVTSPGMVEYTIPSQEKLFNETLPPGASKSFPMVVTAVRRSSVLSPTEPLSLRVDVDFEGRDERRFREVFHLPNVMM